MAEVSEVVNTRLSKARELVACLEANEMEKADLIVQELSVDRENELFQEVGRLTRELHEALNGFILDSRLTEMTHVEIPDASERLRYVITMTENSANTTLNAVEASIPLVDKLEQHASELNESWAKFRTRQLSKDDFKQLSQQLELFLQNVNSDSRELHNKLSEVLMAQDFQDLTGQIIRKVIDLVHDVEEKLVTLVRISGNKMAMPVKDHSKEVLEGPVVPGVDQGNVVNGQDDVDDLLSSLGF